MKADMIKTEIFHFTMFDLKRHIRSLFKNYKNCEKGFVILKQKFTIRLSHVMKP